MRVDGARDDVQAEIGQRIVEQFADQIAVEKVNAHRGEKHVAAALDLKPGLHLRRQLEQIELRGLPGFFDKTLDAVVIGDLHDAVRAGFLRADRHRGDGDVRAGPDVLPDECAKVHPI